MPIPKNKQELYGKIVGHFINLGKPPAEARRLADRAIMDAKKKGKKK